jgi:hypothetical protein
VMKSSLALLVIAYPSMVTRRLISGDWVRMLKSCIFDCRDIVLNKSKNRFKHAGEKLNISESFTNGRQTRNLFVVQSAFEEIEHSEFK